MLVASLVVTGPVSAHAAPPNRPGGVPAPAPGPSDHDRQPVPAGDHPHGRPEGRPIPTKRGLGPEASIEGLEEFTSLDTASARLFGIPGEGAHVAQMFPGAVNYQTEDGSWRPIDISFKQTPGGFKNAANSFDTTFPGTLSTASPIRVTYPQGSMTLSPLGIQPASAEVTGSELMYRGVKQDTDLHYQLTTTGYEETVILNSRHAATAVTYAIDTSGLSLSQQPNGIIRVLGAVGNEVATIPAPFAEDSSFDPSTGTGASTSDLTTTLRPLGSGSYQLTIALPQQWIDNPHRVFPVTIDPSVVKSRPNLGDNRGEYAAPILKDTYTRCCTIPNYASSILKVGNESTTGQGMNTYMTFDIRQNLRALGDLIYRADIDIQQKDSFTHAPVGVELRRVTQDWDQTTVDFNHKPPVDGQVWATNNDCGRDASGAVTPDCNGFYTFDTKALTQWWIDHPEPTQADQLGSNHGIELKAPGSSVNWKTYRSMQDGTNGVYWPSLYAVVNDMPKSKGVPDNMPDGPAKPLFASDSIPSGATVETLAPALSIKDLVDLNGDPIVVRYQVASDPGFTQIVNDTGWVGKETHYQVPQGALRDGHTYYWRVKASDVCSAPYIDPDPGESEASLCDDLGYGRPTTDVRSFSVGLKERGFDRRWSMWHDDLGNDMSLGVNEATGNLLLDVPLDDLPTPGQMLDINLAYNSQAATGAQADVDRGLSPGWEISAGSGSNANAIPKRLELMGDVAHPYGVTVVGSRGKRDVYAPVDDDGLYATLGPYASSLRLGGDGITWTLTTYSGGSYKFQLQTGTNEASLKSARPKTSTPDPTMSDYTYSFSSDGRIQSVTTPGNRTVTFTYVNSKLDKMTTWASAPASWSFHYLDGKLSGVTDPEGATVGFGYDTSGRLNSVKDGQAVAENAPATMIDYTTRNSRPWVDKVTHAGVDHSWKFDYVDNDDAVGRFAARTLVTDPRGVATGNDANDYQTVVDFNSVGLPIDIQGPRVDSSSPMIVTHQLWDAHGNRVCVRGPAANAITDMPCLLKGGDGQYPAGADGLQTDYDYQGRPPYLPTNVTGPGSGVDDDPRLVTSYAYDEGFKGLQTQYFSNNNLVGIPDAVTISPILTKKWFQYAPNELGNRADNFSVRFFGEINADHTGATAKDYQFRVASQDGARAVVGNKLILDCWDVDTTATTNCDSASESLTPGWHSIFVDYQAKTGDADVKLQWKRPGFGTFSDVPTANLRPNTDVVTSESVGTAGDPTKFSYTQNTYSDDDAKIRGLATKVDLKPNPSGGAVLTNSYVYDAWGQLKSDIDGTGLAVTHTYDSSGCEKEIRDRDGLFINRSLIDAACDIKREEVSVGSGDGPPDGSTRLTNMEYDNLGRAKKVTNPDGGVTNNFYDNAGRLTKRTVTVDASHTRTWEFDYNDQGWLEVETLPDPDYGSPAAAPEITHFYDDVGNEIRTVDQPRPAEEGPRETLATFDARNLQLTRTDPLNTWTFTYDAAGNLATRTDPSNVTSTRTYDVLGNVVSRKLAGLAPTKWDYNSRGDLIKKESPDGDFTSYLYDAAGHVTTETIPADPGGTTTRQLSYDSAGRLHDEENFSGAHTVYTYTGMGRLKTVALPIATPNVTRYSYNTAGELTQTALPTTATGADIVTTYTHDSMGRVKTATDGLNHKTTFTYNLAGESATVSDPRGYKLISDYDGLGNRISRSAEKPVGTTVATETFTYDNASNLRTTSTPSATVALDYDAADRLETVTAGTDTTTYHYVADHLKSMTDHAGTTCYGYEADTGRLSSVADSFTNPTITTTCDLSALNKTTYQYSDGGRVTQRDDPTGLAHAFQYEANTKRLHSELVTRGEDVVARFEQGYDKDSRVTTRTETIEGSDDNGPWTYGYDDAGRMTTADGNISGERPHAYQYGYDGAGNRTLVKETAMVNGTDQVTSVATSYDAAGRPTRDFDPTTDQTRATYQFDETGELTNVTDNVDPLNSWTYSYDSWGHQTAATQVSAVNPASISYDYDALDRVVDRALTVAGVRTIAEHRFYSGTTQDLSASRLDIDLLSDANVDAKLATTRYAYAQGQVLAQQTDASITLNDQSVLDVPLTTRFLGTNPHGDVSYLSAFGGTDPGATVATTTYDPWGDIRSDQMSIVDQTTELTDSSTMGFQGDITDDDTGLVDMGARNYAPGMGRFTTVDPASPTYSDPFSVNAWIYGGDSPVTMWDPTGRSQCVERGWCSANDQGRGHSSRTQDVQVPDQGGSEQASKPSPSPSPGPNPARATLCQTACVPRAWHTVEAVVVGVGVLLATAAYFAGECAGSEGAICDPGVITVGTQEEAGLVAEGAATEGIDLAAQEAAGGHLLSLHVGLSEGDLAARLGSESISGASSFFSETSAQGALESAFRANESTIADWLSGGTGRLAIEASLEDPAGIYLGRGASSAIQASNVRFILERSAEFSSGFRVHTGYLRP
jgi:RHS repeat-associated protein